MIIQGLLTDFIIILLAGLAAYTGYRQGLISRLLSLAKIFVSFYIAGFVAPSVGVALQPYLSMRPDWIEQMRQVLNKTLTVASFYTSVGFIVSFIVLYIILSMLLSTLKFEHLKFVGTISSIGGALFNIIIWYIFLYLATIFIQTFMPSFYSDWLAHSRLIQFVMYSVPLVLSYIMQNLPLRQ